MRVAYIITRSDAVGGAQVHVRDLSVALRQQHDEAVVLVGGEGPFTDQLRSLSIPVQTVRHLVRQISPVSDVQALLEIWQMLRKIQPDLVSTHSSKAGWLGRMAAKLAGVPCIFTAHGWSFSDGVSLGKRRVYALAERTVAGLADQIITVSEYDRLLALRYRVAPPDKVVVIHNGVLDVAPTLRAKPERTPPRLVMVARFEEPKDHKLLITALSSLVKIPWTLDLIGDGPLRPDVEELATQLSLRDRVRFLGARNDVAERLAEAQIFVLVSKWEGFPRSILEAMRAGLPVVSSDVGGARESVQDGITGFVVPRGDVEVLRARLERLLTDPQLRQQMGASGRRKYESQFTFEHLLQQTKGIYQKVLEKMQ